jgi:gliding motility-associated lipoprotein GldD
MTKMYQKFKNILFVFVVFLAFSCHNISPKPHSYFRIDFPDKQYRLFDSICPFVFEYPVYGAIIPQGQHLNEYCWLDVSFPKYRGTIHMTYHAINENFDRIIEDNWRIVYSRLAQRADAIEEYVIYDDVYNVFGMKYFISGNAASSVQFFLTDSVNHFVRGSLYFYTKTNVDSLAPVINFFKDDIFHIAQTFKWK